MGSSGIRKRGPSALFNNQNASLAILARSSRKRKKGERGKEREGLGKPCHALSAKKKEKKQIGEVRAANCFRGCLRVVMFPREEKREGEEKKGEGGGEKNPLGNRLHTVFHSLRRKKKRKGRGGEREKGGGEGSPKGRVPSGLLQCY